MRLQRFSLIELLTVIGTLALLIALAFPVYHKVKNQFQLTSCANRLRQIGICVSSYANDNKDFLPLCERLEQVYGMPTLKDSLVQYASGNTKIFICPADKNFYASHGTSYEWNSFISGKRIDKTMFIVGNYSIIAPVAGDAGNFHNEKKNYLYSDGRIKDSFEVLIKDAE